MSAASGTGLFLTLEGGDGVGKSTHSRLLAEYLVERGRQVVFSREPGGTPLGEQLRALILHSQPGAVPTPRAEALLYAADRAQNIATVVRPAIESGAIVIQDRYLDSSVAYQGAGRELSATEVRDLSLWATGGLLPDATFLLDVPVAVARERVAFETGAPDRLEREKDDFHERVRQQFLVLASAEPQRWCVINAAQEIATVQRQIRARVDALLSGPHGAQA